MRVKVSRKAHFNAAHRIFNKNWDDKRNEDTFGKCNGINYHGHNYELIVSVTYINYISCFRIYFTGY